MALVHFLLSFIIVMILYKKKRGLLDLILEAESPWSDGSNKLGDPLAASFISIKAGMGIRMTIYRDRKSEG